MNAKAKLSCSKNDEKDSEQKLRTVLPHITKETPTSNQKKRRFSKQ